MNAVGIFIVTCLAAGCAASAFAASDSTGGTCVLAETSRHIGIETRRFQAPAPRPGLEDVARLLIPSPCETSPAPRLSLEIVALGLLAEDWRQGTEELEQRRFDR